MEGRLSIIPSRERHLRNGKEARDLSSSRQETPEAVKKVRRDHLGNVCHGFKRPNALT